MLLFVDAAPGEGPLVLRDLTLEQGGGRFPETGMLLSDALEMERCALEGGLAYEPWEDLASDDLRIVDCTFTNESEVAVEALVGNATQGVASVDAQGVLVDVADAGATHTSDSFASSVTDEYGMTSNVATCQVDVTDDKR